jgi:hypothetical protein
MDDQVDILNLIGVDHFMFYNSGQDVNLIRENEYKPFARIFKRGTHLVYRAEGNIKWDDEAEKHVDIHLDS